MMTASVLKGLIKEKSEKKTLQVQMKQVYLFSNYKIFLSLKTILKSKISGRLKSYLRYKMITCQNVSSEAQIKNFFIW